VAAVLEGGYNVERCPGWFPRRSTASHGNEKAGSCEPAFTSKRLRCEPPSPRN
jgi:hypothetical protein